MNDFFDKAKKFAAEHDEQVDKGIGKAGEEIDRRTDEKHSEQVEKGVRYAQEHTRGDQD